MYQKEWVKRLNALADKCIRQNKYAMLCLYLTLSNVAAEWIKDNLYGIKQGDLYLIPLESGLYLQFLFFDNVCELQLFNYKTKETMMLVSKEDSAIKEYFTIKFIEETYELFQEGLGMGVPSSMYNTFFELKVGDGINFPNHNTYCCIKNIGRVVTLAKLHIGRLEDISYKTINEMEMVDINVIYSKNLQDLFVENRSSAIECTYSNFIKYNHLQEFIYKMHHQLKPGHPKKYNGAN